jgi:hypothetical protein
VRDDLPRPLRLIAALKGYSNARADFLQELGIGRSNRDPLAEFSEYFVGSLLDSALSSNRVQKGYDLIDSSGRRVQVRYLANPADTWVNEHLVNVTEGLDDYALVLFENLEPIGLVIFPREAMASTGLALGKRHPNQSLTLQFTRENWRAIRDRRSEFARLGVRTFLPPDWGIARS